MLGSSSPHSTYSFDFAALLFIDRLPVTDYTLTEHAIKRCRKRRIFLEWIAVALAHPARTVNDKDDPALVLALLAIPERGFQVLRVIYNETVDPVVVVTVYFDDEASDL
ncbi:MAG: DUF4258 domain-containing protein [Propionivibrio sp.]|uniref:DUF4258 domain-containing protein n=1 Tax=Propionivibrio sp. TaxID=2212460 RepID=UPI001A5DC31F|nr:DUF4258 domain-containing protein [Propionivibrio sp.]MBL8413293.1 DUF4258 domain-containing protein [Propionivibrio sp.]